MAPGRLFLVPSPLSEAPQERVIPGYVWESIAHIRHFAVEEERTARRFLSKGCFKGRIDTLSLYTVNEHSTAEQIKRTAQVMLDGNDMALISEAGLPAVADPGAALVQIAHNHNVEIVPFVGPSSLMMALMSSGLNGQCFAFSGYIPVKSPERKARLQEMEARSARLHESEILIETPYRNDSLFADMLSTLKPATRLCIAADITGESQFIRTRSIAQWRKEPLSIGKRPCVFIFLA